MEPTANQRKRWFVRFVIRRGLSFTPASAYYRSLVYKHLNYDTWLIDQALNARTVPAPRSPPAATSPAAATPTAADDDGAGAAAAPTPTAADAPAAATAPAAAAAPATAHEVFVPVSPPRQMVPLLAAAQLPAPEAPDASPRIVGGVAIDGDRPPLVAGREKRGRGERGADSKGAGTRRPRECQRCKLFEGTFGTQCKGRAPIRGQKRPRGDVSAIPCQYFTAERHGDRP